MLGKKKFIYDKQSKFRWRRFSKLQKTFTFNKKENFWQAEQLVDHKELDCSLKLFTYIQQKETCQWWWRYEVRALEQV
jgi:hypothetical protein